MLGGWMPKADPFQSYGSSTFCVVGVSSRSWPERCCDVWRGWTPGGVVSVLGPTMFGASGVASPGAVLSGAEGRGGVASAGSKSVSRKRTGRKFLKTLDHSTQAIPTYVTRKTPHGPSAVASAATLTEPVPPQPPRQTQDTSVELH